VNNLGKAIKTDSGLCSGRHSVHSVPICDLSILQALIEFDTPFCSVKIRSEYNTFSASEFKQQWHNFVEVIFAGSAKPDETRQK